MRTGGTAGDLAAAWSVEWLKARRSRVPAATAAVMAAVAGLGAVFMLIAAHPDGAARVGILRQKAAATGLTPDWAGLLAFLSQVVAVGGLIIFSFVAVWVFGREFSDDTVRYLLALPVPRRSVVLAKFALVVAWCLALTGWLTGLMLLVGLGLDLPGGTAGVIGPGVGSAVLAAVLMIPAVLPVGLVASWGRGYLAPLAAALGALVTAQVAAALGWAAVVPWSVPAVAAGLAPGARLSWTAWAVAALTGAGGIVATIAWWQGPDAGR